MAEEEKEEKPSVDILLRATFPTETETKLVNNWNVLPLRIFGIGRSQGVRFIQNHKKTIFFGRIPKWFIVMRVPRFRVPFLFKIGEEEAAYACSLESDIGTVSIAYAEQIDINGRTAKIALILSADELKELDKIVEHRETLLADLTTTLTAVQQLLEESEIEINVERLSLNMRFPGTPGLKPDLNVGLLSTWVKNTFQLQEPELESFNLDRLRFDWKRDDIRYTVEIDTDSLYVRMSDINIKGDPITISQRLNTLMSEQYKTIQNMKQIAIKMEA